MNVHLQINKLKYINIFYIFYIFYDHIVDIHFSSLEFREKRKKKHFQNGAYNLHNENPTVHGEGEFEKHETMVAKISSKRKTKRLE